MSSDIPHAAYPPLHSISKSCAHKLWGFFSPIAFPHIPYRARLVGVSVLTGISIDPDFDGSSCLSAHLSHCLFPLWGKKCRGELTGEVRLGGRGMMLVVWWSYWGLIRSSIALRLREGRLTSCALYHVSNEWALSAFASVDWWDPVLLVDRWVKGTYLLVRALWLHDGRM